MNCIENNQVLINQLIKLLDQINDQSYCEPLSVFNGGTIGKHIRHVLDFYQCLLKGVKNNKIDYASRERDVNAECSSEHTKLVFERIQQQLCELEDRTIMVVTDFFKQDLADRFLVQSTINRELMFIHDHAIHHLAIVKIGINHHFPEIKLNPEFGVAPATILHQQKVKESC